MSQIEDIILQDDRRSISGLRPYLSADFVDQAATMLGERKGRVFIATGFYILSSGSPETDGPPGALALALALRELGSEPIFVTDSYSLNVVKSITDTIEVVEFPLTSHLDSADFANSLIKTYTPSALVSVERVGLSVDGTYRNMRNLDISKYTAKLDHLFDQHPFSVGIGDGGNEIGMGNFHKVIPEIEGLHPNPSVTTVTHPIIASCSNWGAFGLVAALSINSGRDLLPSLEQAEKWIELCVEAGAVDGVTGKRKAWVDGKPPEEDGVCLRDLHALLKEKKI